MLLSSILSGWRRTPPVRVRISLRGTALVLVFVALSLAALTGLRNISPALALVLFRERRVEALDDIGRRGGRRAKLDFSFEFFGCFGVDDAKALCTFLLLCKFGLGIGCFQACSERAFSGDGGSGIGGSGSGRRRGDIVVSDGRR